LLVGVVELFALSRLIALALPLVSIAFLLSISLFSSISKVIYTAVFGVASTHAFAGLSCPLVILKLDAIIVVILARYIVVLILGTILGSLCLRLALLLLLEGLLALLLLL
jgi:hypothetical protein